MYRHFLVPVDDSDASIDAVAHAVALARSMGARITFVHLARAPQEGGQSAAGRLLDERMREMVTVKAEAAARALGVPCESMRVDGPAALASAASAWGCDLVCVAARPGAGEAAEAAADVFAGTHAALLAALDVPVLNCAVRRGLVAARVVEALYRAHRATAAALCERLAHPGLAHPGQAPRGLDALRIPRLGPGDACWLSALLHGRTSVVDAELGELERQHRHGAALFAELERAVTAESESAESTDAAPPARVEAALNGYAQFVWEYFGRKEGVIVPAAQRYLREDDWRELD
ncbi:MAG: universal stress protein, partial [Paraburkholderia sp.]|nr:universal stress protein [Paraburkholderia sp.]